MNSLKILVSSGNCYARHGMASVLRAAEQHTVLCGDGSAQELSRMVKEFGPDVVIADVSGRPQDWKTIAALAPVHRVLVVTDAAVEFGKAYPAWPQTEVLGCDGQPAEAMRWVENFARDGLGSSIPPLQLCKVDGVLVDAVTQPVSITPREREIMELVRQGCCNKRIARALSISITTVRTHRYKMMAKLDLHNAVEIARYAERFGNTVSN